MSNDNKELDDFSPEIRKFLPRDLPEPEIFSLLADLMPERTLDAEFGEDHSLTEELGQVLVRQNYLDHAVRILHLNYELPPENTNRHVREALLFTAGGVELIRSAIMLMASRYQPAPYYLLRSAVNQFWFAHCAASNMLFGSERQRYQGKRFFDVYDDPKPFMSIIEIRWNELEILTGNKVEGTSIVQLMNSFVHSDKSTRSLWFRNDYTYPASPSPVTMDKQALVDVVLPLIAHIRGLQELARVAIRAHFVLFDPAQFWSLYNNQSMVSNEWLDDLLDEMVNLVESGGASHVRLPKPSDVA
jgi:hypothetical protein